MIIHCRRKANQSLSKKTFELTKTDKLWHMYVLTCLGKSAIFEWVHTYYR